LTKYLDNDLERYAVVNGYNGLERSTSSEVDKGLKPQILHTRVIGDSMVKCTVQL